MVVGAWQDHSLVGEISCKFRVVSLPLIVTVLMSKIYQIEFPLRINSYLIE